MNLSVGWPLALVALLLCPLVVAATIRSRYLLSRHRRILATASRVVVVAAVVLAIADLRVGWPTDDLAVATIVDPSASVSDAERSALAQELVQLRAAHGAVAWSEVAAENEDSDRTDLSPEVGLAVAALPRQRVRRLLLATDGRDGGEALRGALLRARESGVDVSVLPLGESPPADVLSVAGVDVPRLVRAGETIDVGVRLWTTMPVSAHVTIRVDDEETATTDVTTARGSGTHHVAVTFPEAEGIHELVVQAAAAGDVIPDNNRFRTLVRVLTRPRVLILTDPRSPAPLLAATLRDARFRVDAKTVLEAPSDVAALDDYGLVILDEANPGDLSEAQQLALRTWVETMGGGLVTVTGGHAIRRTPQMIREIEPVQPPPAIPEPRPLELVLVIDRSSSMDGRPVAQARAAAVAAIRALRQDAMVGTVAFSGAADRVMAPVSADRAEEAVGFVSRITAGGGTNIAAALASARAVMSTDPRYIHHVILLSDGESDAGPALAQASALAASGVTVSAITLGPYSQLMAQIARIGRGRYHVTRSPGSLPGLFVREAQFRQPPAHRQVSFHPRVLMEHRMIEGIDFDGGPNLLGHALAEPRRGADGILGATGGDVLLAHWHVGLGQVATFTSSTNGGWADQWRDWPGFRTFWSQVAWTMLRSRTVESLELRIEPVQGRPEVRRVIAVGPEVEPTAPPIVQIARSRDEPRRVDLSVAAPGVWQAEVPLGDGFLVDGRLPADPEPSAAAGADHPYPEELRELGPDRARLEELATLGGGRVLSGAADVIAAVDPRTVDRSLRLPLLVAALLVYLFGLLLMRLPDRAAGIQVEALPGARPSRPRHVRHVAQPRKEAA